MNKELQLTCIPAKKRPHYVEGTKHELFPNHLSQNFDIVEKNTVWCTDFTYLETALLSQKQRPKGLILHSGQGSQFASYDFTEYCLKME